MNRLAILFLSLTLVTVNINAHKDKKNKKINKTLEFIKGTAGLAATLGFSYLAFKTPIREIGHWLGSIKNNIHGLNSNSDSDAHNGSGSKFAYLPLVGQAIYSLQNLDKIKICAIVMGILAWESGKYTIKKYGNVLNKQKSKKKAEK